MEELAEVAQKDYEKLLLDLRREYGEGNPLYVRRSKYKIPRCLELVEQRIKALQEADLVKVEPYIPPWIEETKGHRVENTQQRTDPDVMTIHLLPKAEEVLKSRTMVTRTETTIQETFQKEEPTWMKNQRFRDFARTERGATIMMMSPEALASDVRSHIQAIKSGTIPRKDMKSHQMWLRHELGRRWDDIPPDLRHEAEDCRDLSYSRRKQN